MPAQQNSSRGNATLLCNGHNGLSSEKRATGAAQRAVSGDVNTLLVAEVNNLLLGQRWVVLDLVDGRDDGGLGQERLQVRNTAVGDTDGPDLAIANELLHALPGGNVGVAVVNVPGSICELREDGVVAFAIR